MGSHINCIIPKSKEYSLDEIIGKLKNLYIKLKSDFKYLSQHGEFGKDFNGDWLSMIVEDDLKYICIEGGSFRIDFYKKVIHIGCVERFNSLYDIEKKISKELLSIINNISLEFCAFDRILIGQGGFGDTDYIMDMTYEGNSSFDDICFKMKEINGSPAIKIEELNNKCWYLKNN